MNQNEIVYEFTLDSPWSLAPLNVTSWVHDFVERRYSLAKNTQAAGGVDAHDAWSLLSASAYNNTDASIQVSVSLTLVLTVTLKLLSLRDNRLSLNHHLNLFLISPGLSGGPDIMGRSSPTTPKLSSMPLINLSLLPIRFHPL